jgi:hypothetical protein
MPKGNQLQKPEEASASEIKTGYYALKTPAVLV